MFCFYVSCILTSHWFSVWHLLHVISKPLLSQWDEALLTMSRGETARLEIEPEWAYGKKGVPDSKYPFLWLILCLILCVLCKYIFLICGNQLILVGNVLFCIDHISLTQALPEFLPMQSWSLRLNWCLSINWQKINISQHALNYKDGGHIFESLALLELCYAQIQSSLLWLNYYITYSKHKKQLLVVTFWPEWACQ